MAKKINNASAHSAQLVASSIIESGPFVCRDEKENAIIRAYRGLPSCEAREIVFHYMLAMEETFRSEARPRLTLVARSKGICDE